MKEIKRKATRWVASLFGITAGIAGAGHGYYEILQGNTRPAGLMISSIGPPCVPEETWNTCEPAMTIIPNFLITGILAVLIGLMILLWSAAYMQHSHGGIVLILLSVALLLFGGGFFPPLIGIIGGVAGIWINKPLKGKQPNIILRFVAGLWPWPLAIFLIWVFGQVVIGSLFNDFTQQIMGYGVLLILAMLPLSVFSAYAHDVQDFSGGKI